MSIFALIGCIGGCGETFEIESFSKNEVFQREETKFEVCP